MERKYFSTDLAGAKRYAALAAAAFNDGPFSFVATSIETALITVGLIVVVDSGIKTVMIPTDLLYALGKPEVQEDE